VTRIGAPGTIGLGFAWCSAPDAIIGVGERGGAAAAIRLLSWADIGSRIFKDTVQTHLDFCKFLYILGLEPRQTILCKVVVRGARVL
jgi:hypothetical protein